MPKRIMYPIDYLPLKNPSAEPVLQSFLAKISSNDWTEQSSLFLLLFHLLNQMLLPRSHSLGVRPVKTGKRAFE